MIKVYQYGCLEPDILPIEAETQLRLANRFWNNLVEINAKALEQNQELWKAQEPVRVLELEKEALLTELEMLREGIKKSKQTSRSSSVTADSKQRVKDINITLKGVRTQIKEVKSSLKEGIKEEQQKIWDARKEAEKLARQNIAAEGLYWGNYNAVAGNFQVASKKAAKEGAELHFHRFTGEGTWTVQIQTEARVAPATVKDLFDTTSRIRNLVRVDEVDTSDWDTLSRSERKRRAHTHLHFRVASDDHRDPIWVHTVMKMHRPIPAGAAIKQVQLSREKLGNHWRYTVSFTVDEPEKTVRASRFAVAVDLGWRRLPNGGIRVGFWLGEDGTKSGEIVLPAKLVGGFDQVDRIKSYRDDNFNVAVGALKTWLATQTNLPEWLSEGVQYISQWKSHGRLLSLVEQWRNNRFTGDEDIFSQLEPWRLREKHLGDFELNLRDRLVRYRREIFRVISAQLAESYSTLVLEDMDLRQMVKKPKAEKEDTAQDKASRSSRTIASPGVLRESLVKAFISRSREVLHVDAKNTTKQHASCGNILESVDFSASIVVECPYCGSVFDQDENACLNMLGMYSAHETEAEPVLV